MVDINLLPEELRKKEEKEKEAVKKMPHIFEVTYTQPEERIKNSADASKAQSTKKEALPSPKTSPLSQKETSFHPKDFEGEPQPMVIPQAPVVSKREPIPPDEIHVMSKHKDEVVPPQDKKPRPQTIKSQDKTLNVSKKDSSKLIPEIYELEEARVKKSFWDILKSLFRFRRLKIKYSKPKVPAPQVEHTVEHKKELSPSAPPILPPLISESVKVIEPMPKVIGAKKELEKERIGAPPKPPKPKNRKTVSAIEKPVQTMAINLIPEEVVFTSLELNIKRKFLALILSIVGTFVLVGLIYSALRFYEGQIGSDIKEIDESIEKKKQQIAEYEKERQGAEALQSRLLLLNQLLSQHLHWTKLFSALEKYTVEDVYFTNFSASRDGGLILTAIGKDYTSVARQLLVLQEARDFILIADINSATAETGLVDGKPEIKKTHFSINIKVDPKIFLVNLDNR